MAQREFTGRHAAILFCSAFGVIIAVNITLAVNAVATFPGLEAKNTYVASQEFDTRRTAQQALGWTVTANARGRHLALSIRDSAGHPVQVKTLDATVGRATHVRDVMADADWAGRLRDLYAQEVLPGFAAAGEGEGVAEYVATTLERFANPYLDHRLEDIAQNHPEKLARRIGAFLDWAEANGDTGAKPQLRAALEGK